MTKSKSVPRTTVKIPSNKKEWNLDAWQYLPSKGSQPFPVIVMAHGFGSNKLMALDVYAEAFVKAGYACMVFDYRRWGASDGTPRHAISISEQLQDYRSVVKYCRQQAIFDPQRVVVWGTSFSGGHAISMASEQKLNVKAAIAQCPFTGGGTVSIFSFGFLLILISIFIDLLKQSLWMGPFYIPIVARPLELGALTSPDSVDGMKQLVQNKSDFPNQVTASSMLTIPLYSPSGRAREIKCPILVISAENDTLCSPEGARRVATQAEQGECEMIPGGHFEVYPGGQYHKASLDAQLNFLKQHVPV